MHARVDARGCNNKYGRVTGVNARKKYDSSWRRGHRRNGEGGYAFPCFRKRKKNVEAESVAATRPHAGGDIGAYFCRAREKVLLMSYNTFRVLVLIPAHRIRTFAEPSPSLVTRHGVGRVDATGTGDFDDRGIIISGVFN